MPDEQHVCEWPYCCDLSRSVKPLMWEPKWRLHPAPAPPTKLVGFAVEELVKLRYILDTLYVRSIADVEITLRPSPPSYWPK